VVMNFVSNIPGIIIQYSRKTSDRVLLGPDTNH